MHYDQWPERFQHFKKVAELGPSLAVQSVCFGQHYHYKPDNLASHSSAFSPHTNLTATEKAILHASHYITTHILMNISICTLCIINACWWKHFFFSTAFSAGK